MSAVLKLRTVLARMSEADLDELMAIENSIYSHPWSRGNFADSLRAGYECRTWRLAPPRGDALLAGYFVLAAGAGEAHLLNLSVASGCQRSGHGSALLREALALAAGRGARDLFLEVRPSNHAAQALYRRFGFHAIALRKGYYPALGGGREDALVLSLALPA